MIRKFKEEKYLESCCKHKVCVLTSVKTVGRISFGFKKETNSISSSHCECSLPKIREKQEREESECEKERDGERER